VRIELTLFIVGVLCGGSFAVAANRNAPGPCLHYQRESLSHANGQSHIPKEVTLSGKLIERTFWGPPDWGDHPDTDTLEDAWILVLDTPICVLADPANSNNNQSEYNVVVVQLAVLDPGPNNIALKRVAHMVGRHVTVTGVLNHAVTGHNRTPVQLAVASVVAT
jgi:Domain of unknown function (DUF4431)